MRLRTLQIPPPLQSQDFEHLSLALFKRFFNDPLAQLNGVSGQKQNGLDIIPNAFQLVILIFATAFTVPKELKATSSKEKLDLEHI